MRKRIAFTLILVLMLSLLLGACQSSGKADNKGGLQVGYSKVNITPNFPVVLGGYGDYENRIYDMVLDYLYITCIAVTEGDQTVLIYTCDNLFWITDMSREVRPLITKATGVPDENIFFSATHTHGAPMVTVSNTGSKQYRTELRSWAVEAAEEAMADRAAATVSTGSKQIEGMNFVRHYLCSDGSYTGSNFNLDKEELIVDHAGQPDNQMTLIKFDRADKKDILMVNWQAHADHTSENGYKALTADYPGVVRYTLENETGMEVAYFTGASGNLNAHSKIPEKEHGLKREAYGQALAQEAMSILENMTPMTASGIKVNRMNSTVTIDHSWDHAVAQAKQIISIRNQKGKDAATAAGKEYDFSSPYQADMIVSRATMPATSTMELNTFCIGDIGFVNGSYEMFCENGMYIKENSPFATTFIMEGNLIYLATEAAYDYRSYEADTSYYVKGTAEKLAEEFVQMLNAMK